MKLRILLLATFMTGDATAETLSQWLAGQLRADEQLLSDSLSQVGSHSFGLLKGAQNYVPFFLEPPQGTTFASAEQKASFEDWVKEEHSAGFLPGGYIYRLKFKTAPTLYATSAGYWEGETWRCLALGKDIAMDPQHAWEMTESDGFYGTLLAGMTPRLIVYDQKGELKRQDAFDPSMEGWEQRLEAAISSYSRHEKPVLEMISLSEYLNGLDAPWRTVDLTGRFNLRNQQHRPDEQERLKLVGPLTRSSALSTLQASDVEVEPTSATASGHPASSTPWSNIGAGIAATVGLLWWLLKGRP